MKMNPRLFAANLLYFLAVLLGLALALATNWADYEAVNFFYDGGNYDSFAGLRCPNVLSLSDTGTVTAAFDNPTPLDLSPYFRVVVGGVSPRTFDGQLTIPPHQTRTVQWTVNADDLNYGNFIFVKLDIFPDAYYQERVAVCGILALNLPFAGGGLLLGLALSAALLGMVFGLGLWAASSNKSDQDHDNRYRARQALGVFVSLAILAGLTGWWAAGTILCVLTVLLLFITMASSFS